MKALEDAQKINLFYFDESGFTTASSVPYARQPKGQTLEIPCFHSKRLYEQKKCALFSCT